MQVIVVFSLIQPSEYCDCKVLASTVDKQKPPRDLMVQTQEERLHQSDCTLYSGKLSSTEPAGKVGNASKTMKLGCPAVRLILKE